MNITVIGTGYVGLVTGACFSEMGNFVNCVDVDAKKIDNLKLGILPIYEPGLEKVVLENFSQKRLHFSVSLQECIDSSDILFIAVGTPPGEDGSADLQYVLAVAREIGRTMSKYSVIVDKSTVPVGTADKVRAAIQEELDQRGSALEFDVVSNPEFLKEGAAVSDFMSPDRIIVGTDSERAKKYMTDLYAPFVRSHPRLVFMGVRDAEMTKYAANAMLATKISFMNEISLLCEKLFVDVESVRLGIGSDSRIGFDFIYPGAGYGGSCFPKDVKALIGMSKSIGVDPVLLRSVEDRNEAQKKVLYSKIVSRYGTDLKELVFGVWGLSFKPGTDDMREAASVVLISALVEAGAKVKAYDPIAMETAKREFPENYFSEKKLTFCQDLYDAAVGADALVLVTEWKPFRHPDFSLLKSLLKKPIIFDGRNQYDPKQMVAEGFTYHGIGREFGSSAI